jgi:hypothetical protein
MAWSCCATSGRYLGRGSTPLRRKLTGEGLRQLAKHLATFVISQVSLSQVIALYEPVPADRDDTARRRRKPTSRLVWIEEMYG